MYRNEIDTRLEELRLEIERFVDIAIDLVYDPKLHKQIMIELNDFVDIVNSSSLEKEEKELYISMAEELLAIASDSTAFS
ncbi:TPA: hypothetical protein ACGO1T_001591 [Streptococcus suis]